MSSAQNPNNAIVPSMPRGFVKIEPDDDRYVNKFHVNSASSDAVYRISYDRSPGAGWWICSCMGCKSHGSCKHLLAVPQLRPTRKEVIQKRIGHPSSGTTRTDSPKPQRRLGRGRY